jgi:hypothetical protein
VELIDKRLTDEAPHAGPLSEKEKRDRLDELVQAAKLEAETQRSGLGPAKDKSWSDLRDFYDGPGQNWSVVAPGLPSYLEQDWSVTNHTKAACQVFVSTIVNALPVWYVVEADSGEQDEAAGRTTTYLRAWRQFVNYDAHEKMAISNALQVGLGVLKPWWNPGRGKHGEVVVDSVRPENIFPDPTATRIEECSFIAIRSLYGLERALKLFDGEHGTAKLDLTKVDLTYGETDEFASDTVMVNETKASQQIVVWEVYYDFGERLMIYSNEQTLFDGESPVPESDVLPHRYPLHFYEFEPRDDCFWPRGLVQELMDPQNRVNKTNFRIAVWQRYFATPIWDTTDQAAKDSWDATPGSMNYHQPESEVKAHYSPPLPADVFGFLESSKGDLDNISGSVEVTRGLRPTGVNTGIALQVLHEAAHQRMTGPASNWTYTKAQIGQRIVELMQKHYSQDRKLAIVQEAEGTFVEITADDLSREEPTGKWIEDPEGSGESIPEMETKPREYVVVTQPGGDLPLSASARAEMAVQLAQIPIADTIVDQQAVLDAVQFPGRDAILERRAEMVQAQEQGQMEAMQAQQQMQGAQVAQQQLQVIAQQLKEMLPPEMLTFLQQIVAGTMTDEQMIEEFMMAVRELGDDVYALVVQFLQLSQQAGPMQPQGAPQGGPMLSMV